MINSFITQGTHMKACMSSKSTLMCLIQLCVAAKASLRLAKACIWEITCLCYTWKNTMTAVKDVLTVKRCQLHSVSISLFRLHVRAVDVTFSQHGTEKHSWPQLSMHLVFSVMVTANVYVL